MRVDGRCFVHECSRETTVTVARLAAATTPGRVSHLTSCRKAANNRLRAVQELSNPGAFSFELAPRGGLLGAASPGRYVRYEIILAADLHTS
jgi:hypothetical protein